MEIHGNPLFPCTLYDQWFDDFYTGAVPWHWHEDMELGIVTDGTLMVRDNDSSWTAREGEGYFFNSGIMHEMEHSGSRGEGSGHLLSVVFDPDMIAVMPRTALLNPRGLLLKPDIAWQADILDRMKKLFVTGTTKPFGYELSVLSALADIVFTIVNRTYAGQNRNSPVIVKGKKMLDETRIKTMLDFIRLHYAEDISVAGIASEANISESECYRIFKRILETTPVAYLLNFRIRTAADELNEPGKTISEICYDTGFNSPAYFTKVFRQYCGYTPKEFRGKLR